MEIINLASSSEANCYLIKNEKDTLMIEAGLDIQTTKNKLLSMRIIPSSIRAVAVTHAHGDHARGAGKMSIYAPIYASKETLNAIQAVRGSGYILTEWESVNINSFRLTPFNVDHDCEGAMGFIIEDKLNFERLLFINDTKYVKYDFSAYQFDYIMIECNHNDEILDRKDSKTKRTANSHMSLETTKKTLESLNLNSTKTIYLMHLSDGNSDQNKMIKEVMEATGKPTFACKKHGGFDAWKAL